MRPATFIFTSILTLSLITTFGQDTTKLINEIRKEFKTINNDATLKKVALNNEDFLEHTMDGGAQLTGFYKAGQLKKIVRWFGLSNGNEIFEYYFKNQQLIFVYAQFNSFVYDKEQIIRFDTTEKTFVRRYYFYDNKLIDKITTGHNRFEDDTIDAEKTLLTEANDNKKLLERNTKGRR